jgi:hypothetical protein
MYGKGSKCETDPKYGTIALSYLLMYAFFFINIYTYIAMKSPGSQGSFHIANKFS